MWAYIEDMIEKAESGDEQPTQLFHIHNLAIPLAYFAVGAVSSLITTPLNIYMVTYLNVEPAVQNTIYILKTLPWSLKLLFGFMSDACPINGCHRKPYLIFGSILYSLAMLMYALAGVHNVAFLAVCILLGTLGLIQMDVMADTMCVERSKFEDEEQKGQLQATCYSVRFSGSVAGAVVGALVSNQRVWGWGLSFLQVCFVNGMVPIIFVAPFLWVLKERYQKYKHQRETDSPAMPVVIPVTEKSKLLPRPENARLIRLEEALPTSGFLEMVRTNSLPVRSPSSSPGKPEYIRKNSLTPSTDKSPLLPHPGIKRYKSFWVIEPEHEDSTVNVSRQIHEVWETVQLQAVWRPMAFVYVYNLMQIPNVAWQSYLQLTLHFPSWMLGLSVLLGSIMTLAGIEAYKRFFFKASWRVIYVGTTALVAFFSLLQLVLIFQWNVKYLHMSNYFFSLGDDVIAAYVNGIQFLPVCIMYMRLCPDGAEGASYSMLTTYSNVAFLVSADIGNYLSTIWDVSNDALREGDIRGMWKLSLLTSLVSVAPLCLLYLLPKNAQEQAALVKDQYRSKTGGIVFLTVLFISLTWTIASAIGRLIHPAPPVSQ